MLDLHRLTLLREVGLHGSITAAARRLNYTHSAVSQHLSQLERETGVTLIMRVGRSAKLTPAGERLVKNTEAILSAVERAESDLADAHDRPQGEFSIAAFASVSRTIMPQALALLAEAHPELTVQLTLFNPEEATRRLVSRQVDAVVIDSFPGIDSLDEDNINVSTIADDGVRAYIPVHLKQKSIADLQHIQWVMEPKGSSAYRWAIHACRSRGFEPRVVHESSDLLFHVRMVEQGIAAAFLPDLVVNESGLGLKPERWPTANNHRSILYLTRDGAEHHPALESIRAAVYRAFESNRNAVQ